MNNDYNILQYILCHMWISYLYLGYLDTASIYSGLFVCRPAGLYILASCPLHIVLDLAIYSCYSNYNKNILQY